MQPLSFQPSKVAVDSVPLETYNEVVKELERVKSELIRCRQKVAHLLKKAELKKE